MTAEIQQTEYSKNGPKLLAFPSVETLKEPCRNPVGIVQEPCRKYVEVSERSCRNPARNMQKHGSNAVGHLWELLRNELGTLGTSKIR